MISSPNSKQTWKKSADNSNNIKNSAVHSLEKHGVNKQNDREFVFSVS